MAQQDLISLNISATDLAEIQGAITTLKTKLSPHLRTLSVSERVELPKMGDKTVSFVQKAREYGQKNGHLVPAFLDLDALAEDVRAVETLRGLSQELGPLTEALDDSTLLAGSEAYQAALVFYAAVKSAAKVRVPNASFIYDDLASRFPGAVANKKA